MAATDEHKYSSFDDRKDDIFMSLVTSTSARDTSEMSEE